MKELFSEHCYGMFGIVYIWDFQVPNIPRLKLLHSKGVFQEIYVSVPRNRWLPIQTPKLLYCLFTKTFQFKAVWLKFFVPESNTNTCWFIRSDTNPWHSCSKFLMMSVTLVHNTFADLTNLPISPPPPLPDCPTCLRCWVNSAIADIEPPFEPVVSIAILFKSSASHSSGVLG